MKKFLSLLLAGIMIISCMTTFASCASKPEMDLDDAEDNLEDEGYNVSYDDDYDELGYEEYFSAYKDDDELTIIVFSDSKLASLYYEGLKAEAELEKDQLKALIKFYERILKKYDDDLRSADINELEGEIKYFKDELEEYDEYVIGKSGKTVWYGTKDAIKDSKG